MGIDRAASAQEPAWPAPSGRPAGDLDIAHILKVCCHWCDGTADYGSSTTVDNRVSRRRRRRNFWFRLLDVHAGAQAPRAASCAGRQHARRPLPNRCHRHQGWSSPTIHRVPPGMSSTGKSVGNVTLLICGFPKLKWLRRVAARSDETACSYLATLTLPWLG